MNQNPSSNKKDTIGARWHGDVNVETILGWHAFAYLYTLLGCFSDVLQTNMDDGDPHDVDMELEGNGALDIYDDALVIAYLQVGEIPIRLTPKERDRVVHRAKRLKWEGNSLLRMWVEGQVKDVLCPKQRESLVKHAHEELGHFGVQWTYSCSRHNTGGKGCNCKFSNLFLSIWCVFGCLSMHLHLTYSPNQLWGLGIDGI